MPVFFARWPDGSFSIVSAMDETDAYVQLDEIADEPAEVWEMQSVPARLRSHKQWYVPLD